MTRQEQLRNHQCKRDESWPEHDGRGYYLCRVCAICQDAKLSIYDPKILRFYTQADMDEPLEPEEDWR